MLIIANALHLLCWYFDLLIYLFVAAAAHTCFNQLDLVEYESKEQLRERLRTAIHEGAEGFGFA